MVAFEEIIHVQHAWASFIAGQFAAKYVNNVTKL
jgi:hypothetical protein